MFLNRAWKIDFHEDKPTDKMRGTRKHTNEENRHFMVVTSNGLCFKLAYRITWL